MRVRTALASSRFPLATRYLGDSGMLNEMIPYAAAGMIITINIQRHASRPSRQDVSALPAAQAIA
jgi:hypothetical protein